MALTGLAQNTTLSVQGLDQAHEQLWELENDFDSVVDKVFEIIRNLREAQWAAAGFNDTE